MRGSNKVRLSAHTRITNVAFEREAAFKEAAPTPDDPPYTATATLWKVEETASNV